MSPPNKTRKPTSNVRRNVDSESRRPHLPKLKKTPSIKDLSEAEDDSEVEQLFDDLELSEPDESTRAPLPKSQRAKKPTQRSQANQSSSQQPSVVSSARARDQSSSEDFLGNDNAPAHMIVSIALHAPIHSVRFPAFSTFIPNSAFLFIILNSMHTALCENTYLYRTCPSYNTILSRAYYSVLWFMQVLRAKSAVGNVTRSESTLIRRFERTFPFESLPVAGPLVTYFSNLAAVKTDDPMYNWICPFLPAKLGPAIAGETTTSNVNSARPLYPWFPGIISLFQAIRKSTQVRESVDENQAFTPFLLSTGGTFAGVTFPAVTENNPLGNVYSDMLQYAGINIAPEQIPDTFADYQSHYLRLSNIPTVAAQSPLDTIDKFLLMDEDMSWFSTLTSMATSEARFFKGTVKFADIPSVTGLSTLVVGTMADLSSPQRPAKWYPDVIKSYSTSYSTTRGRTSDMDFRVGISNSIISSFPSNHPSFPGAGSRASGHLTGEYFNNTIIQRETPTAVTVVPLIQQNVRLHYYDPSGDVV